MFDRVGAGGYIGAVLARPGLRGPRVVFEIAHADVVGGEEFAGLARDGGVG